MTCFLPSFVQSRNCITQRRLKFSPRQSDHRMAHECVANPHPAITSNSLAVQQEKNRTYDRPLIAAVTHLTGAVSRKLLQTTVQKRRSLVKADTAPKLCVLLM